MVMSRATEEPEVEESREVERRARVAADEHVELEDADAHAGPDIAEDAGPEIPDEPGAPALRKRPLYRRPAFMLVAAVVLVAALVFGLRYWTYARAHESTDDAFIDGSVVQV